MRAVVIGAGPAGLSAAHALRRGGADVVVVEPNGELGGLARSVSVGSHWVDLGPHRLHVEASSEARELLGGEVGLVRRPRAGRIHIGEKSVDYPLSPLSTLFGLGALDAARFAFGSVSRRHTGPVLSYADEAERRVGAPLYRALYAPAARKIWGRAPEQLDADQARARVGVSGRQALLGRLLGRGEPGHYLYPAAGANGHAYRDWGARLTREGVEIRTGWRAERVEHAAGRVGAVIIARRGEEVRLPADRVVSTLPLPALLKALSPLPSSELGRELTFRSVVLVHVVLTRSRLSSRDVHYFPGLEVPYARLTEQCAFGRPVSSPVSETVITFDLYDDRAGPWVRTSVQRLRELVWPRLQRMGVAPHEIVDVTSTVVHDAYPVLQRGYRRAREDALDALAKVDGLLTTGRGGLFLHVNQHHAIEMGLAAGKLALDPTPIAALWRRAARRFEQFRVVGGAELAQSSLGGSDGAGGRSEPERSSPLRHISTSETSDIQPYESTRPLPETA